jgi:peptide-methionine (S)-S-oxide reductase
MIPRWKKGPGGCKVQPASVDISTIMLQTLKKYLSGLLLLGVWLSGGQAALAQTMTNNQTDTIIVGGGCFWCVEAVFQRIPGVKAMTSGYAGGNTENPTYRDVCSGTTGHAEVAKIEFDPQKISLEKLLDYFWDAHDPTTLNRQGADEGTQYRSIILYRDDAQKAAAEKSKAMAQKRFRNPIVTEIVPLKAFYPAEKYHQNYYNDNPNEGYCRVVIRPKVEKIEKQLKAEKH